MYVIFGLTFRKPVAEETSLLNQTHVSTGVKYILTWKPFVEGLTSRSTSRTASVFAFLKFYPTAFT